MARFAPLRTGQFVIKPRALKRQRVWLVLLLALLVIVPYLTFELGRARGGFSVIESMRHQREQAGRIDALESQVTRLQRELNAASLDSRAQAQAYAAEQQSVAALQMQLQQQQQDLTLYQAIVSPQANAATAPRVQRLDIEALPQPQHYRLRIMMIQSMNATTQAQGTLEVVIAGQQSGRAQSVVLSSVLRDPSQAALSFAYRYFQSIERDVALPAGFEPAELQVSVQAARHELLRQSFPWQLKVTGVSATWAVPPHQS